MIYAILVFQKQHEHAVKEFLHKHQIHHGKRPASATEAAVVHLTEVLPSQQQENSKELSFETLTTWLNGELAKLKEWLKVAANLENALNRNKAKADLKSVAPMDRAIAKQLLDLIWGQYAKNVLLHGMVVTVNTDCYALYTGPLGQLNLDAFISNWLQQYHLPEEELMAARAHWHKVLPLLTAETLTAWFHSMFDWACQKDRFLHSTEAAKPWVAQAYGTILWVVANHFVTKGSVHISREDGPPIFTPWKDTWDRDDFVKCLREHWLLVSQQTKSKVSESALQLLTYLHLKHLYKLDPTVEVFCYRTGCATTTPRYSNPQDDCVGNWKRADLVFTDPHQVQYVVEFKLKKTAFKEDASYVLSALDQACEYYGAPIRSNALRIAIVAFGEMISVRGFVLGYTSKRDEEILQQIEQLTQVLPKLKDDKHKQLHERLQSLLTQTLTAPVLKQPPAP